MTEKILTQKDAIYTAEESRALTNGRDFGPPPAGTGSSRRHNLIGSNTTIAVGSRIRGQGKEVYVNDMRVKLAPSVYSYPDVVVVAGPPKFEGGELDILLNPTLVVEIMSRQTLFHDKTEKLDRYLALESVREILLVKEEEMRIEHYSKQTLNTWTYRIYTGRDDVMSLDSINTKISVGEIYGQIRFD